MNGLRPLFDDLVKETRIINEALQPFPSMRERLLFIPAFSVKGLRSAWPWAGPVSGLGREYISLQVKAGSILPSHSEVVPGEI